MNIVTGSNGLIGSHLLKAIPNSVGLNRSNINELEYIASVKKIECVYHFAAEVKDESKMIDSNIILANKIIEVVTKYKIPRLVFCGSSSEYGVSNKPMAECDVVNPNTLYSLTKVYGTMLSKICANNTDCMVRVVRPFSVYGVGEKSNKLFPTIMRSYELNSELKLDPKPVHDWVYIDDFIYSTSKLFNNNFQFDIINIGTGIQTSNKEVVSIFNRYLDYKLKVIEVSQLRPYDNINWVCDTAYSKALYGIENTTTIECGIKKFIDDWKWKC